MERRRPVVDAAALKFMTVEFLSGADFVIRDDGVLRLTPQLARWIYQLFDELRIRPVAGLPLTEQVASHLQPVP